MMVDISKQSIIVTRRTILNRLAHMALSESRPLSIALGQTLEILSDLRDIDEPLLEQLMVLHEFPGRADVKQLLARFIADQDPMATNRFAVGDDVGVEIRRRVSERSRRGGFRVWLIS